MEATFSDEPGSMHETDNDAGKERVTKKGRAAGFRFPAPASFPRRGCWKPH